MHKDLPRRLTFCVVGHTTQIQQTHMVCFDRWYGNFKKSIVSPKVKQSPLMKGELELEIKLE